MTGVEAPAEITERPESYALRLQQIRDDLAYTAFRDHYAGIRVVVLPTPTENPGGISTLLEAMAMDCPTLPPQPTSPPNPSPTARPASSSTYSGRQGLNVAAILDKSQERRTASAAATPA